MGDKAGVEYTGDMAWVPARPKQLIGRDWPQLGAALSTIWHRESPPERQLAEARATLLYPHGVERRVLAEGAAEHAVQQCGRSTATATAAAAATATAAAAATATAAAIAAHTAAAATAAGSAAAGAMADVCSMADAVGGGRAVGGDAVGGGRVVLVEEMPPRKGRLGRVRGGRWGDGWGPLLLLRCGLGWGRGCGVGFGLGMRARVRVRVRARFGVRSRGCA